MGRILRDGAPRLLRMRIGFADRAFVLIFAMTKAQIDAVLERVRNWPKERQEDAARVLLAMEAEDTSVYRLSPDERADLESALAEIGRGEAASDEEAAAAFKRLRS